MDRLSLVNTSSLIFEINQANSLKGVTSTRVAELSMAHQWDLRDSLEVWLVKLAAFFSVSLMSLTHMSNAQTLQYLIRKIFI